MLCKKSIKSLGNLGFRRGKARAEGIGAVTQNSEHSFFTNDAQALQINRFSKKRRVVHFKVTGMKDYSCRCINSPG